MNDEHSIDMIKEFCDTQKHRLEFIWEKLAKSILEDKFLLPKSEKTREQTFNPKLQNHQSEIKLIHHTSVYRMVMDPSTKEITIRRKRDRGWVDSLGKKAKHMALEFKLKGE